jgi:hypothetical protein
MREPLTPVTVEDRLAALESEVAMLKMQLKQLTNPEGNWLEEFSGSMKHIPSDVWQRFQEHCKEIREADRPAEDLP